MKSLQKELVDVGLKRDQWHGQERGVGGKGNRHAVAESLNFSIRITEIILDL